MPNGKDKVKEEIPRTIADLFSSLDERMDRNHEVLKEILEELRVGPPVPAIPPERMIVREVPTIVPGVPPAIPTVVVIPSEVREVLPPEIRVLPPEVIVSWGPLLGIFDLLEKYREIEEWTGIYKSVEKTIDADEKDYEILLRFPARMVNIRTDQDITLKLNDWGNDEITLESAESPLDISGLKPRMRINSIYITTGANDTEIKIMAFG